VLLLPAFGELKFHTLDEGPDSPMERGNFWEKGASHCKVQGHSTVICAKTAEPIEMPFGLWARIDPRNYVLDGVHGCQGTLPWPTNFGTKIAITGFV